MSKDDKNITETVTLDISDNLWTTEDSKKVLQEVKFDNWNNDFNSVDTVTINTSEYLSPHGTGDQVMV